MDLFSIGAVGSYTKQLRMQTKWDLKKASGKVSGHDDPLKPRKTREAAAYQQIVDSWNADGDDADRMTEIMNKLNAGKKLTPEERDRLKARAPEVYRQLENAEREQKDYEQELKRCKTKEEVQRVKAAHMSASLTRMEHVKNDPNIPEEKKQMLLAVENSHVRRLGELERRFVKRGDYARLPTDAEKAKAEKEEKEARTGVRGPEDREAAAARRKKAEAEREHDEGTAEAAEREADPGLAPESPERRKLRQAKLRAAFVSAGGEETFVPSIRTEA